MDRTDKAGGDETNVADSQRDYAHIVARTADDLFQIGARLHDENFEPGAICQDKAAGTLEIPFRRIFHDGPSRLVKNRLIYWVDEVDVLRCSLRFLNVATYTLVDRTNIGALSLNRFHYDEAQDIVTLLCCEDCDFSIRVNGLHVEYREIEYCGKARITRGYFWDSNSDDVYE